MEISKERREKSVNYIVDGIKDIIVKFGPRDPGSEGERKAQEYMAEELRKYSDEVTIEDFKVNPGSFMGWIPISVTCVLIAYILSFFVPFVSLLLIVIGMIPMISQFVLYKNCWIRFSPKKFHAMYSRLKSLKAK